MARTFSLTSGITLSLGNTGTTFGPGTVAAILRRTTDSTLQVIYYGSNSGGGANRLQMAWLVGNTLQIRNDAASVNSTYTVVSADGWVLIAVSKATGTATPRMHKYVYATDTWTHENASGTLANSGAMTGNSYIGRYTAVDFGFIGDIAVAAKWSVVLGDTQVEALPFSLMAWFQSQPDGLWVLDQAATTQKVLDLSGGGANESALAGTSVATTSVPVFGYGSEVILPEFPSAAVLANYRTLLGAGV